MQPKSPMSMLSFATTLLVSLMTFVLIVIPMNASTWRHGVRGTRSADAVTNTWMSVGPNGAEVSALAVDHSTPSTVFAGTGSSGIFASTDAGASWSQSFTPSAVGQVTSFAVGPASFSVYAFGEFGVWQSQDEGRSWDEANGGVLHSAVCGAIDPTDSAAVYVANSSAIFKTTTGGLDWQQLLPAAGVVSIAIDPTNPATVYAGSDGPLGGILKSTDRGLTWATVNSSPVIAFAMAPSSPATLYGLTGPTIIESTDGGATWISRPLSGLPFEVIPNLVVDPTNPATIYGATFGGEVVKSTDSGASFAVIDSGLTFGSGVGGGIAINPINTSTLYAGSGGTGVYKTTNGGESWAASNSRLVGTTLPSLVVDPSRPATIYAAGRNAGAYKSTDGGDDWAELTSGITINDPFGDPVISEIDTLALDPGDSSTLYAAGFTQGVFKSTDAGASWIQMNSGLTDQSVGVLAVDPKTSGTVYAGTLVTGSVFKTVDGGLSWRQTNLPTANFGINTIAIDPANDASIYVGRGDGAIFNSTDGGLTWNLIDSGIGGQGGVSSLVIDPHHPSTIYAGFSPGGAYKSTDSGNSWAPINLGFGFLDVDALAIDPSNSSTLYAGTIFGVFISADAGNTWTQIRTGLGFAKVSALAIDPVNPTNVFGAVPGMGAIKIQLAPDFLLGFGTQSATVTAGGTTQIEIIVGRLAKFAGKVTVTVSKVKGFKAKPASISTKGSSVTFTISVSPGTETGEYTLIFTGVDRAGLQQSVGIPVKVQAGGG